jgi:hypothetical protein
MDNLVKAIDEINYESGKLGILSLLLMDGIIKNAEDVSEILQCMDTDNAKNNALVLLLKTDIKKNIKREDIVDEIEDIFSDDEEVDKAVTLLNTYYEYKDNKKKRKKEEKTKTETKTEPKLKFGKVTQSGFSKGKRQISKDVHIEWHAINGFEIDGENIIFGDNTILWVNKQKWVLEFGNRFFVVSNNYSWYKKIVLFYWCTFRPRCFISNARHSH